MRVRFRSSLDNGEGTPKEPSMFFFRDLNQGEDEGAVDAFVPGRYLFHPTHSSHDRAYTFSG